MRLLLTRDVDIIIGRLPKHLKTDSFVESLPYLQDELIWCIQDAGMVPIYLNLFWIAPLTVWGCIFAILFSSAGIFYIYVQFDDKFKTNRSMDIIYMILMVVFPALSGISPKFNPTKSTIRMFYSVLLFGALIGNMVIAAFFYNSIKEPIHRYQVKSNVEIANNNYRLAGSDEILHTIRIKNMVKKHCPKVLLRISAKSALSILISVLSTKS